MKPISLSQEVNILHAEMCSALADPTRILILYALHERPRCVNELAQDLAVNQPAVSRHLKILRERGLVRAERQGVSILYSLTDARLIQALDLLRLVLKDRIVQRASLMDFSPES